MNESENFLMKCLVDHEKNTQNMNKEDVLVMALKIYKSHLRDLIYTDMQSLKSKKDKYQNMLIDLADDADIEHKLCESAKEQRDDNQY
jgi:hypothetical protein